MYTPHVSTVLKTFIYVVVIALILCSIGAAVGYVFADKVTSFPLADLSKHLCTISTILLVIHLITFCLVLLFQITKLYNYLGYIILSMIATLSYMAAWMTTPGLFPGLGNLFH